MVFVEMGASKRKCDKKERPFGCTENEGKGTQDRKNNFNVQHAQQLIDINQFCFFMSSVLYCMKIILKYEKIYIETIETKLVSVDLFISFWVMWD